MAKRSLGRTAVYKMQTPQELITPEALPTPRPV